MLVRKHFIVEIFEMFLNIKQNVVKLQKLFQPCQEQHQAALVAAKGINIILLIYSYNMECR